MLRNTAQSVCLSCFLCLLQIYMHNRQDITETNLKPALLEGKEKSDGPCCYPAVQTRDKRRGQKSSKERSCWPSSFFMMYRVFLRQLSALRLLSWRLKQQHSRGTGPDWPWSESRKRRPDWTCWVSISQS